MLAGDLASQMLLMGVENCQKRWCVMAERNPCLTSTPGGKKSTGLFFVDVKLTHPRVSPVTLGSRYKSHDLMIKQCVARVFPLGGRGKGRLNMFLFMDYNDDKIEEERLGTRKKGERKKLFLIVSIDVYFVNCIAFKKISYFDTDCLQTFSRHWIMT